MVKFRKDVKIISVITATVLAVIIIAVTAVNCGVNEIKYKADFYFICYRMCDDSVSASSLSQYAGNLGGAGYIMEHDGNYYVTLSCYYNEKEAETVCESIKRRGLECTVLNVCIESYKFKNSDKNTEKYIGIIDTLFTLSCISYECANGLDTGNYNQNGAKEVISSIKSQLNGIISYGAGEFNEPVKKLIAVCDDRKSGYIYSKDLRYLQIAICDSLIKTNFT